MVYLRVPQWYFILYEYLHATEGTGLVSGCSKSIQRPTRCSAEPHTVYFTDRTPCANRCSWPENYSGRTRVFLALSYTSRTTPNSGCQ